MAFDLVEHSVDIILKNQAPSGAYLASPNFSTYQFSWFRDGAFIAYAMDRVGQHESAAKFHAWAAEIVNARAARVRRAIEKAKNGQRLTQEDILNARYPVTGAESGDDWPNFQLDGFGTWLWALDEHAQQSGQALPEDILQSAGLVAAYLNAFWSQPCYDCWEEFGDQVHLYTLAAIHAGLRAEARLNGSQPATTLRAIQNLIRSQGTAAAGFNKFVGGKEVDASLLGLAVPYGVVSAQDARMQRTVARIESELRRDDGGVHRYASDSYYGGGEWLLLTAWLGWYYAYIGERAKARALQEWVLSQADEHGDLPEQVPFHMNESQNYAVWRERWGEIARPLLWSHAMYLILAAELNSPQDLTKR